MADELPPRIPDPVFRAEDVDTAKWNETVTRGELFAILQAVRMMIFASVGHARELSAGNHKEAAREWRDLSNRDAVMMEGLIRSVTKDKTHG